MEKLSIQFENCYGINKLNYDFDFSEKSNFVIYSPNGTMKTSLAKTFKDFSSGNDSEDSIFPERETSRLILDSDGNEVDANSVFVIEPYIQSYRSEKISTLLVNADLKKKYDKIHADINKKKDVLLKELIKLSGVKKECEEKFSLDFTSYANDFFKALGRVRDEVLDHDDPLYSDIIYTKVFSDKIISFLETKDFKDKLRQYIDKYDELIDSSKYFKKGIFNHNNASVIAKNLKDNGYFEANHTLFLNSSKEIKTEEELEKVIQHEKDAILNDPDLAAAFEEIDGKLKANKELREFRDYLIANQKLLAELGNIRGLKEKVWISYLKSNKKLFIDLWDKYVDGKDEIGSIVDSAKEEETDWLGVIDIFNRRFDVPFKLKVVNQDDVILKREALNIKFLFEDRGDTSEIEEGKLFECLSNGESRALYILNIIFEVQARKNANQITVFVIDDIADSFDYKNKYAIIEYLNDISKDELFYQIILTHNYDFFRTVSKRLDMNRENKLHTVKTDTEVLIYKEKYQNNPFNHWKNQDFRDSSMLIASIAFVRNIVEFTGDDGNYNKLTSMLHIKQGAPDLYVSDLEDILKNVLLDKNSLSLEDSGEKILDLVYRLGDELLSECVATLDLEKKISLAVAIRLKAEEYMIREIADDSFVSTISKNQTSELYKKYIEIFPTEAEKRKVLERVNLMTPENIHVNSFMYEPILDMDASNLRRLYQDVKDLI